MQKPSIPKGTRDFTPQEMVKREYIFETIKAVFKKYGYSPIETPAMENLSTLLGKYGEEGDKLLFRILNSGDFLSKANMESARSGDSVAFAQEISKKGLRYDLTVPFARFVVQHRNEITFPFRRYQIQPVWRADRPQKGRYQEFFQCDADVVGSDSLINETELIQIIDEVFNRLGLKVKVKLNNRKILAGIAEVIGAPDKLTDITVAIDKLEKTGMEKVIEELRDRGLSDQAISGLEPFLHMDLGGTELLERLSQLLGNSETGKRGIAEVQEIVENLNELDIQVPLEIDLTLARGLNYYTGAIIEVKSLDMEIGSICGGGRYDDLTGIFGMPGVSGVGISFGADRIYDVLNRLNTYPENVTAATRILIINFGRQEQRVCLQILKNLRQYNIPAELYPDPAKLKKQMNYANACNIPWVLLVGEEEIGKKMYTLKNMQTGEQESLSTEQIVQRLSM